MKVKLGGYERSFLVLLNEVPWSRYAKGLQNTVSVRNPEDLTSVRNSEFSERRLSYPLVMLSK